MASRVAVGPAVPDRIYVHQLNVTSADRARRLREKAMVEEEARKVRELRDIRRRQREEEKKRDMEMLLSYDPWGKPGAGAQSEETTRRRRHPEGREDDAEDLVAEQFLRQFGRPGHGAPHRTLSGRLRTQLAGDPDIRFQDAQDVRLSIENQLRYKGGGEKNEGYRRNLDELIQEKQKLQEKEREWENRKLEEMLEKYPFGKEPNNDPMFMATRPKRIAMKDEDFDPWGKGFGNPARDPKGNVQRHKSIPSVDQGIPDPPQHDSSHPLTLRGRVGGAGDPHLTDSGHRKTRLRNTLRNLKAMGPHVDDAYDPWGRPGGGAPFVREDARGFEEKLGWSMTGHPKKRSRDAKNEYRNELQQEIQEQYQKKHEERLQIHEPIVRIRPPQRMTHGGPTGGDVASLIRRGAGGRPRKDPATGELLPNPRRLTDVTQERLDIRRVRSQECLAYHGELSEQAAQKKEHLSRRAADERAQSRKHLVTWDSFWGRPGHGAPRDPVNHKKENIQNLLEQARAVDPYVKHYITEVVPSKHNNRYDVPSRDALALKREYEFRTPFPATAEA